MAARLQLVEDMEGDSERDAVRDAEAFVDQVCSCVCSACDTQLSDSATRVLAERTPQCPNGISMAPLNLLRSSRMRRWSRRRAPGT